MQNQIFRGLIKKWSTAQKENKKIISVGDINLNSECWDKNETEWTPYQTQLKQDCITAKDSHPHTAFSVPRRNKKLEV